METSGPEESDELAALRARYRDVAAELAAIGFVARGSVISATTTCSTPGCHCHVDPARRHGPYWQWTRTSGGVSRTRRLSEAEARLYQGWIANRREAEAILAELEALSEQAAGLIVEPATATPRERTPRRRARPDE